LQNGTIYLNFDTLKLKGRKAHLEGAEALMANAGTFSKDPKIY
jgi:hypothetical protein